MLFIIFFYRNYIFSEHFHLILGKQAFFMDKRYLLLILSQLFTFFTFATNSNATLGAVQSSLAGNDMFVQNVWAAHNNVALLGNIDQLQAGVFYQNRFMLKQLGLKAFATALPLKNSAFGLSYNTFGYSVYQENQLKLAYGMKLGEKVSAGVGLSWLNNQINSEYAQKYNFIIPEMAVTFRVTKTLSVATSVFNPMMQKIKSSRYNERVPTIFKLGAQYKFSDKAILHTQINKDLDFDASLKVGIEYLASEKINLYGGIATTPTIAAFGVGYKVNNWNINFGASVHQQLGVTPSVGIIYRKK